MAALIATFSQSVDLSADPSQMTFNIIPLTNFSIESAEPDKQEDDEGLARHVLVETFAVFGAMFVAAIAIVLVSVYVSRMRKRQNQQLPMAEVGQSQEETDQPDPFAVEKPGAIRRIFRGILLRLRGQEQHKDVCEIPPHLRAQLKQIYVY